MARTDEELDGAGCSAWNLAPTPGSTPGVRNVSALRTCSRSLAVAAAVPALALSIATPAATGNRPSVQVTARFAPAKLFSSHPAVTYDTASVPVGSRARITQQRQDKGGDAGDVMIETLRVWSLKPRTKYYAYAHTRACGASPAAAGPRTQDAPSRRHYPQNEIWLGFTTNAGGDAASSTSQYWLGKGQANSILIESGPASAPVACITAALESAWQ